MVDYKKGWIHRSPYRGVFWSGKQLLKGGNMKYLIMAVTLAILSGCMTVPVDISACDKGSGPITVNIYLDKTVDTLPIDAKARDVQIPLAP